MCKLSFKRGSHNGFRREWNSDVWNSQDRLAVWAGIFLLGVLLFSVVIK